MQSEAMARSLAKCSLKLSAETVTISSLEPIFKRAPMKSTASAMASASSAPAPFCSSSAVRLAMPSSTAGSWAEPAPRSISRKLTMGVSVVRRK